MASATKKIDPLAYSALCDALPAIYWRKAPWQRFLKAALREAPEILSGLDFSMTKREVAGLLVDRLMENERKYQGLTISLMLAIAKMESFPDLMGMDDSEQKIAVAKRAVSELRVWTGYHGDLAQEYGAHAKKLAKAAEDAENNRAFSKSISELKGQFLALYQSTDPQKRGIEFEGFINRLFHLFDLEPRCAYSLEREQIDGAFSFDTDDYVLEARWWKGALGREHLDIFTKKVERKGKNALGLCISINGFTGDALAEYSDSTSFITMDGQDLYAVLEERIRLDEMLRRKKRHANETGDCYLPVNAMF